LGEWEGEERFRLELIFLSRIGIQSSSNHEVRWQRRRCGEDVVGNLERWIYKIWITK
jgi:hypothetical protein